MRNLTIVGARPQFIKAFVVSRELHKQHEEILVHTGQHYDKNLSKIFFEELKMDEPEYNLGIGSGTQGYQTAEMIRGIEEISLKEEPDFILLYGDTNSTIAGALVGAKSDAKVAHIEAGLRSYNWNMPEEVNRILTDHASDLLFAPSETAVKNLESEGITDGVHNVGDVMYDAILWAKEVASERSEILDELELKENGFVLSTVHRAANTDNKDRLKEIMKGLSQSEIPVVLPIHPRTKKCLKEYGLWDEVNRKLKIIEPVGYLDFVRLLDTGRCVATDSGGVQKEAFFLDTHCITLRDETEWIETVECGWNVLVGADQDKISDAVNRELELPSEKPEPYGDGEASKKIVEVLEDAR